MPSASTRRIAATLAFGLACTASMAIAVSPHGNPDVWSYNLAHGRVVFTEHCLRCHGEGRHGAPVVGDVDHWLERLDQPLDELIAHAIQGHGEMPARGDTGLVDQEIASAVAFVVYRGREMLAANDLSGANGPANPAKGASDDLDNAVKQMLFLLMVKE